MLWGTARNQQELASLYCSVNLTLITSKRETFSMVCAESLCCGTPVVGFKAGGPESIAISDYSDFVEYGNIDLLKRAVEDMLKKKKFVQDIAEEAKNIYSREKMARNYLNVYKQLI